MKKIVRSVALGALLAGCSAYAASVAVCAGCHGQHFEKQAMGKSKIVKDMSLKDIITALKGYKAGTYGDTMKGIMEQQVKHLSDSDIEAMAVLIKTQSGVPTQNATKHAADAAIAASGGQVININEDASDPARIEMEDLGNRNSISDTALGLRKTDLMGEDKVKPMAFDYDRPAPGASKKFERAYKDAPPMIPHSVEGLLPITKENNQCLGCHLPEVAKSMGATPIPPTHFTDYRPETIMKDGKVIKEGKVVGKDLKNTADLKLAKAKRLKKLYEGRFNCTQCHAPQARVKTEVANTFKPDYRDSIYKEHSSLADAMNEGIDE